MNAAHDTCEFRGKRVDGKGWVYGNLNRLSDGWFIMDGDQCGFIDEPDYYTQGMGCGLEDRGVTDRYEAMRHGWERAIERQRELLPDFIQVDPATVGMKICDGLFYGDIVDVGDGVPRVVESHQDYIFPQLNPDYEPRGFDELLRRGRLNVIGNIHDNRELVAED